MRYANDIKGQTCAERYNIDRLHKSVLKNRISRYSSTNSLS